ncbi:MAG: hypothetical protein JOZ19_02960 [Rubrobacter sp.]|nr:hypothetical protein [Rubrobacter sp.]
MSASNLMRWGGLAAVVAGLMFIIVDLIAALIFFDQDFSQDIVSIGLIFQSAMAPVAEALLLLGLVALYTRQSEAVGVPGLISFVVAFLGTVLSQDFVWANLLLGLGWALFGVSCLRSGLYPRVAAGLLMVGALVTGLVGTLVNGEAGSILTYIGADVVLNVAIAWLGFSLFLRREEAAGEPSW